MEKAFQQLNKAGDGKLTLARVLGQKEEGQEAAEAAFKAADKANKGYLTLDEFKTIYGQPHRQHRGKGTEDGQQAPDKPADKTPEKTPGEARIRPRRAARQQALRRRKVLDSVADSAGADLPGGAPPRRC